MKFKKYSSIENTSTKDMITKIKAHGYDCSDIRWSVSEKVHGANLYTFF
jgi:hypothetical protein